MAKATRRDLRRAFGAEALGTIAEQEQATNILASGLNGVRSDVAVLARDHAIVKSVVKDQRATVEGLSDDLRSAQATIDSLTTFRTRGFRARLRWVFTGR